MFDVAGGTGAEVRHCAVVTVLLGRPHEESDVRVVGAVLYVTLTGRAGDRGGGLRFPVE